MPFRRLPKGMRPERVGTREPLFYTGTLEQTKALQEGDFASALKRTGLGFDGDEHALMVAGLLKKRVLMHMQEMHGGHATGRIFELEVPGGKVELKLTRSPKGRFLLRQNLSSHGITKMGSFSNLKSILREGFKGGVPPNVSLGSAQDIFGYSMVDKVFKGDAVGDHFKIKLAAPYDDSSWDTRSGEAFMKNVPPELMGGVTITLDCGKEKELPRDKIEGKKAFYRKELKEFGIPIRFVEKRYL
jgi:hypothetical protein